MQNELDIVRDVSARLDGADIGYMLTGSMAMNYYAQPRMTRDIDIVVDLKPGDAVAVTGPAGKRFLLPEQPDQHDEPQPQQHAFHRSLIVPF